MEETTRAPASDSRRAPSAAGGPAAQGLKRPWWVALTATGLMVLLLHGLLVWWVQAQLPTLQPQAEMPVRFTPSPAVSA